MVGFVGVAAGGAGVFLSDNQAGTTAILLLGAVFLLMGIRGTAIIKAGKDSVELARHRRAARVAGKGKAVLEEQGVEEAQAYVEEALSSDPGLAREPELSRLNARLTEEAILQQIEHLARTEFSPPLDFVSEARINGFLVDGLLRRPGSDDAIMIEVAYANGQHVQTERFMQIIAQTQAVEYPCLSVGNRHPTPRQAELITNPRVNPPVHYVLWRSPDDNLSLVQAVNRLLNYFDQ